MDELAGEDLGRMMQELLFQRSFEPVRLRKYGDRFEVQASTCSAASTRSQPRPISCTNARAALAVKLSALTSRI